MNSRRDFLSKAGLTLSAFPFFSPQLLTNLKDADSRRDQDAFWYQVQKAFYQTPKFINLENGYFSPQPTETLKAHAEYQRSINEMPSWFMRREQRQEKGRVKRGSCNNLIY